MRQDGKARKAALSMDGSTERTAIIVGQYPLWLEARNGLLRRLDIFTVHRATLLDAALTLVDEHSPDLVIADADGAGGCDEAWTYIPRIKERRPQIAVVVLSANADEDTINAAFAAGVDVYCTKMADADDVSGAIRQLFADTIYIAGARSAKPDAADLGDRTPGADSDLALTRRELEILQLAAEGYPNAQLARMLWVTEQTVKFHLSNIYRKLDVSNRTEASRWAQLNGLLPRDTEPVRRIAG